jgi:hypothetical protein
MITGGANTLTGLIYEGKVDLKTFLNQQPGYRVVGSTVIYQDEVVAQIFQKYELYSEFLAPRGIDWKNCISSQLLPDNGIYVIINNTVFIIEVKTPNTPGSVDEKLQTCDFKRNIIKSFSFP